MDCRQYSYLDAGQIADNIGPESLTDVQELFSEINVLVESLKCILPLLDRSDILAVEKWKIIKKIYLTK
ncbi:hypothetical protein RDV78_01885 [Bacillota bacterium LX-D]|nr:hypothetical protein [Bacillota bacterium LX-D]